MKKIFVAVLILSICSSFVISCDKDNDVKIKELKQQVQIEKRARETAQNNASEAKSSLNLLIGLSIAVALFSLLVGVAMGSKARKEAKRQNIEERADDE